jgi:hypothetical protein
MTLTQFEKKMLLVFFLNTDIHASCILGTTWVVRGVRMVTWVELTTAPPMSPYTDAGFTVELVVILAGSDIRKSCPYMQRL